MAAHRPQWLQLACHIFFWVSGLQKNLKSFHKSWKQLVWSFIHRLGQILYICVIVKALTKGKILQHPHGGVCWWRFSLNIYWASSLELAFEISSRDKLTVQCVTLCISPPWWDLAETETESLRCGESHRSDPADTPVWPGFILTKLMRMRHKKQDINSVCVCVAVGATV